MEQWLARAQREVSATLHQNELALRNSIEDFLDQIAEALCIRIAKTEEESQFDRDLLTQIAQSHGKSRAGLRNYSIESLIFEFHILRQTICDVLEEDAPLSAAAREIITSIIEQAVNDAAASYSNTLRAIRERLTATLVHDLRNPIAAAKMGAQMIQRKSTDSVYCASNADRIVHSLDRVSALIEDVLDASRLGAGERLPIEFEACDLKQLLQRIASEYNRSAPDRVKAITDGNLTGHWNPRAIQRIIENLVTNALKYGAPEQLVTINARSSGDKVILTVHNHGPAIPKSEQDVLFQQFRRAKGSESESGWGLGLVIVKGLTEAHGGNVEVESSNERGTSFIVTIPKNNGQESPQAPHQEAI